MRVMMASTTRSCHPTAPSAATARFTEVSAIQCLDQQALHLRAAGPSEASAAHIASTVFGFTKPARSATAGSASLPKAPALVAAALASASSELHGNIGFVRPSAH